LLPEHIVNRIAAGEVVERPASVLKELVENSLDSGASRLDIECGEGGKSLIRVTDNGCGMNREELFLCLERHATSKLRAYEDLSELNTLGFRGEALPSIASVSRFSIVSSPGTGEGGHKLRVEGGKILGMTPFPANKGTSVEVRDLFFNVPARRKFLKTTPTEEAHAIDAVQRYALSRDDLAITFVLDGRTVLSVPAKQDFRARLHKILGENAAKNLIPFSLEKGGASVRGYLGTPDNHTRASSSLYLYVLGRPVKDRLLLRAVTQGYGKTLAPGRYPVGVVFLDLPRRDVDVNVHPAKTEVRFRNGSRIFALMGMAVSGAVSASPLGRTPEAAGESPFRPRGTEGFSGPGNPDPPRETSIPGKARGSRGFPDPDGDSDRDWDGDSDLDAGPGAGESHPTGHGPAPRTRERTPSSSPWDPNLLSKLVPPRNDSPEGKNFFRQRGEDSLRELLGVSDDAPKPLAQLRETYILASFGDGLHIIDQHAAHERILFNRLKKQWLEGGIPSKNLIFPETFDLSAQAGVAAAELDPGLRKLGYEIERFGGPTFVMKAIPVLLDADKAKEALLEILNGAQRNVMDHGDGTLRGPLEEVSESWLYSMACRAAIKAGHSLTPREMEVLINDTIEAEAGGFCPHGRPSSLTITYNELEKKFGRK
jgi:DNA mismatch repair protein MutL